MEGRDNAMGNFKINVVTKKMAPEMESYFPRLSTRWFAWIVILTVFGSSCAAVFFRGEAVEWLLLVISGSLITCGWIVPPLSLMGIEVQRELERAEADSGESVKSILTIKRKLAVPFGWMIVEEKLVNSSLLDKAAYIYVQDKKKKNVQQINSYRHKKSKAFQWLVPDTSQKKQSIVYQLEHLERGYYNYEPVTVLAGDWLGLTIWRIDIVVNGQLLVKPIPKQNKHIRRSDVGNERLTKYFFSDKVHMENQRGLPYGEGMTTRPYYEGDPVSKLDYRVLARGQGLHTKVSAERTGATVLHLVDNSSYNRAIEKQRHNEQLFTQAISWLLGDMMDASPSGNNGKAAVQLLHGNMGRFFIEPDGDKSVYYEELRRQFAYMQLHALYEDKWSAEWIDEEAKLLMLAIPIVVVHSINWQQVNCWLELLQLLQSSSHTSSKVILYFTVSETVLSFTMREVQRKLEGAGASVFWLFAGEELNNNQTGDSKQRYGEVGEVQANG